MPVLSHSAAAVTAARQPSALLSSTSAFLGWVYTLAWSASFYPQAIHNQLHHSTIGLSSDFVALNALGHTSYLVYNTLLFFYEPVRRAYRKRHAGNDNVVQLNDWVFSLHATLLALITLVQYLVFRKPRQHLSQPVRGALTLTITATVFLVGAKSISIVTWLDVVNFASTVKLAVTLTKYIPQIKLNATRKSTLGFSIENILLDLTGGVLSLAQLVLDAVCIQGSWAAVVGDWGKLGLSLLSIAFDAVLTWQHYAVYGPVQPKVQAEEVQERTRRSESGNANSSSNYGSLDRQPHRSGTNDHADEEEAEAEEEYDAHTEQTRLLR